MQKYNFLKIFLLFLVFNNLESRLLEYQQIATQEQLDKYGRLYDFYIMPKKQNNNTAPYIALFGDSYNSPNTKFVMYGLDDKFNVIWQNQVDIPNLNSRMGDYNFIEINNKNYFVSVGYYPPVAQKGMILTSLDLQTGKSVEDNLNIETYYSQYILGPVKGDNFMVSYSNANEEAPLQNFFTQQFDNGEQIVNPANVKALTTYIDNLGNINKSQTFITEWFVDPVTNFWLLQLNLYSSINANYNKTQFLVYDPINAEFISQLPLEDSPSFFQINLNLYYQLDGQQQYLSMFGNNTGYKTYISTGQNSLVTWIYNLSTAKKIVHIENTEYWAVGKSGQFFLKWREGLFQLK